MNDDGHEWDGRLCTKCGLQRSLLVETPNLVISPSPPKCEDLAETTNSHDWEFRESHRGPCYVMAPDGHYSSTTVWHNCWVCKKCDTMSPWAHGPPFSEIKCTKYELET